MSEASNIWITLGLKLDGLSSGLASASNLLGGFTTRAGTQLGGLAKVADGVDKVFAKIPKSMLLGTTALVGLGLATKKSLGAAIEFETAWTGVLKTVEGSPAALAELRSEILSMSTEMPMAASAIAEVAEMAGQLGVATEDVAEFTRVMIQLGSTTDLSASNAAKQIARMSNVMGDAALPVQDLANVLVELGNNSAATESEILNLAMRIAPAGAMIKMGQADILGFAAAMKSMGLETESGGTAIQKTFLKMTAAVSSGGAELDKFGRIAGMTGEAFRELFRDDPTEAILRFLGGLQRIANESGNVVGALDSVGLGAERSMRALLAMSANLDQLVMSIGMARNEASGGSAAIDEYSKRVETAAARIELFKNTLNTMWIGLGTPLLGAFVATVDTFTEAIKKTIEIVGQAGPAVGGFFDALGDAVGPLAEALAALGAAGGVIALELLTDALVGLAVGATGVLTVIGTLVDGLIALGKALVTIDAGQATALINTIILAFGALVGLQFGSIVAGITSVSTALTGLGAATLAVAPYLALAGALALLGKGYLDAGAAAQEATAEFRAATEQIKQTGTYAEFSAQTAVARSELEKLAGVGFSTGDGLGRFAERVKLATISIVEMATPLDNTVTNAHAAAQAWVRLSETTDQGRSNMFDLVASLQMAAYAAGDYDLALSFTSERVWNLAMQAGVLDQVLADTTGNFQGATDAIMLLVAAQEAMGSELGAASNAWSDFFERATADDKVGALESLAEALGVTQETLVSMAEAAGIDMVGMLNEGEVSQLAEAMGALASENEKLAQASGMTADAVQREKDEITGLLAAYSDLQSAIEGVRSAREAALAQQDALAAATANLEAVLADEDATIRQIADAMFELNVAYAASGVSAEQAAAMQAKLKAEFMALPEVVAMGTEEAEKLWASLVKLSEIEMADLSLTGLETWAAAQDEADALLDSVGELSDVEIAMGITIESEAAYNGLRDLMDAIGDVDGQQFAAVFKADTDGAKQAFAEIMLGADLWDATEAVAFMNADATQASQVIALVMTELNLWSDAEATAFLRAQDETAPTIEEVRRNMDGIRDPDPIELTARDNATSVIQGVADWLSRLRDKTVNVTVRTGGGGVYRQADGGILLGGVQAFAGGGIAGATRERPGGAKIYSPAPIGRLFAEPVTGGEAYIPLSRQKRGRSLSIWKQTGRMLGAFADGGITGVQAFADGGIASGSFLDPVGIPIRVNVDVNGRGIGELDASLAGVSKSLRNLGQAAESGSGSLVASLDRSASAAQGLGQEVAIWPESMRRSFGTMEEYAARTGQSLDQVRQAAIEAFGTVDQSAETAISSAERLYGAFEQAGIGISRVASETGRALLEDMDPSVFLETMERISGWASSDLGQVLEGFEGSVADTIDWIESAGLSMEEVFRTVFLEAADDIDVMVGALDLLESAMNDTEDASRRLDDSMNFLHGQTLGLIEAQNDATLATSRFVKEIEKGATSGDRMTEAGARTSDSLIRLGEKYRELIVAVAASGAGMEATQSVYDAQVSKFRELAAAAGLSTEDINTLVTSLFQMPAEIVSEIDVQGTEQKDIVDDFKSAMEELDGFLANPEVNLEDEEMRRKLGETLQALEDLGVKETLVTVDAETGQVKIDLEAVEAALTALEEDITTADVDADTSDAEAAVELLRLLLTGFTSDEWKATLTADDQASLVANDAKSAAELFASTPYDGKLTATDNAAGTIEGVKTNAKNYADTPYDGDLTATDSASGIIAGVKGNADAYATNYTATLMVNDNASFTIRNAKSAASGFAGTYTATLNTINNVTTNRTENVFQNAINSAASNFGAANGRMVYPGGHRYMAGGGIAGRQAQIARAGSWITWAEDETGGEAYIPLAMSKRGRSMDILAEVASMFGQMIVPANARAMAYGGFSSMARAGSAPPIVFAPQVSISGVSDERVASRIRKELDSEFRQFRREMGLALSKR